ncbi:MAG: hypothetical protein PF448_12695 [Bacteroidales bacterium]|jgi:hypothetical protein|nr:hypothetical protein [Bacteroidales bacterium]
MKNFTKYFVFILILLIGASCSHKRFAKKASKFEEQGMYQEASDLYYQSLIAKRSYIDAQVGLKRTGQRVVDKMYSNFMTAYNQGNNKQAVYHYIEAESFENKLKQVEINLVVPPYYTEYYNEVKGTYLDDQYFEGVKKLNNEDFSGAERIFAEIVKIEPDYKDSKEKLNIAIYEPKYRQAVQYMGNKKYRSAYYLFDEIIANFGNYKESSDLKNESQKAATIRIAIQDITNHSNKSELSSQIKSKIINGLNQSNDPFLKVIEYVSDSKYSKATKSTQPDAIVKATIHSFNFDLGRLKKETKRGYLEIKTRYKDGEGKTQTKTTYQKVQYEELSMQRSAMIKFDISMVDTRTNEILLTKSFNLNNKDQIHYAKYGGKKQDLVPGYWKNKSTESDEDVIRSGHRDRRALQDLLNARTKIKTMDALAEELINEVSAQTVNRIINYNPE